MKMKKRLLVSVIYIFGFTLLANNICFADIIQKYGAPNLSILDFVLVSSNQSGDILTRTFKLKVKNTGQDPLYNVKATLIHASDR